MQLTESQATKIKTLMLARIQPAYFVMAEDMRLLEWSDNIVSYGFDNLSQGADCTEIFNFLVGYDFDQSLELPIVATPSDIPSSISILLEDELAYVLIMDASKDYDQQFLLQQKANEASLLNVKQRRLMSELISTQRELAQKNVELEDAFQLQRRFLSGVSHEFRTPLTSIIGYATALIEQADLLSATQNVENQGVRDACHNKLRIIANNSKYLLSLVENLLDHGKLEEQDIIFHPSPVNVGDFFSSLHDMLYPIAERKGIDLLLELEVFDTYLLDATRVRQCLINLVNNAIKFTTKGSVIINVDYKDESLNISVKDTGIGMADAEVKKIYTSFWQSSNHNQAGAGLGMTITKRIVESLGGDISIISKLNQGTQVSINFPAYPAGNETEDAAFFDSQEESKHKAKILLVEDDPDICDLVAYYLDTWNCEVHICHDGEAALEWLEENSADAIFLDLNMPVLDGYETLTRARKAGIDIPIYIMSAQLLGNDPQLDEKLHTYADGHILKPVDFRELKALIETVEVNT